MTARAKKQTGGILASSSDPRVLALNQIDRKLLDLARDVRVLRQDIELEVKDRGVLGSRGLTQFLLEYLEQQDPCVSHTTYQLCQAAKAAGFATPNTTALTKRLSEYRQRTGNIGNNGTGWYWRGEEIKS
jgi:hypothetical protein